jgi:hypothetical protein
MTAHGLKEVEKAKSDGRWARAYKSGKAMKIPDQLQAAIDAEPKAKAMLEKLSAQNRFALAFRMHNLKSEAGRKRKIETFVEMLKRGETIYPQSTLPKENNEPPVSQSAIAPSTRPPADHRDRQGLQHLGPSSPGERQWNHSGDGSKRGHQDWPETALSGFDHRLQRCRSGLPEALIGVQKQNSILRHNPDHHDQTHKRRDIECRLGDEQREKNAEVDRSADARIATGAAKVPNSNSSTVNTSTTASPSTTIRS